MEFQIFFWTGKIVCYLLCISVVLSILAATVAAPVVTFYRVKKVLWQWKFVAEIGEGKWTQNDLWWIAATPEKPPCDITKILEWMRRVEERGKHI